MIRFAAAALAGLTLALVLPPSARAASTTLFRLTDPRLTEASGIARGINSPGVFYVQNDSGDSARFFALDTTSGRVRAVYTVPNAQNHDWEDLAVAPDAQGMPSVWLADIGDNNAERGEVQLYRVPEPRVDMARFDVTVSAPSVQEWRLRYPSGPVNAESLAVSPRGAAYVITKSGTGVSAVYAVPPTPDAGHVQTLRRIATVRLAAHGGLIPSSLQRMATGAALSADGKRLVVRTYTDAYVWPVRAGDMAAALRAVPTRVDIPLQPQGEGVCFVGDRLVLDSEHVGSAVLSVPLTASVPARTPGSTAPSAPVSAPVSKPAVTTATSAASASPARSSSDSPPISLGWRIVSSVVLISLGAIVWRAMRRRRRRE